MKIGIIGAGAVGCFLGAKLVMQGADVTFVGRARGKAEADEHGLTIEALDELPITVSPARFTYAIEASALAACDVVLCAVKSAQTDDTARELAGVVRDRTVIISMQNGMHNAETLRARLPAHIVLGGIVGFNVVPRGHGVYRRATSGLLVIESNTDERLATLAAMLRRAGFELELTQHIQAKQWSKLVMNLSNALSALSDVSTRDLMFDSGYRRIMRAIMAEAIAVLREAHIAAARLGPLPIRVFPHVLALPTPILKLVIGTQLAIDPEARSSMWQDLARGRATEVDELNGEIVRLAASCGARAPINERLVEMMHVAERVAAGSPKLSAAALAAQLGL